jgi:hypothetical protein
MFRYGICTMAMAMAVAVAWATADDQPAPPKKGSSPPAVVLARATERHGAVVVRFSLPAAQPINVLLPAGPGVELRVVLGAETKAGWADFDVPIDGNTPRALSADGKPIDPKDLPKRLTKGTRAVLFHGDVDP